MNYVTREEMDALSYAASVLKHDTPGGPSVHADTWEKLERLHARLSAVPTGLDLSEGHLLGQQTLDVITRVVNEP